MKVLSACRDFHRHVNMWEAMDGVVPVYLVEFLHFTSNSTVMCMYQGLIVLNQYPNSLRLFSYNAKDKKRLWKREKGGRLEGP